MELENGFAPPMENRKRMPPPQHHHPATARQRSEKMELDRFLIGGRED